MLLIRSGYLHNKYNSLLTCTSWTKVCCFFFFCMFSSLITCVYTIQAMTSLELKFKRANKVYYEDEDVTGIVVVNSKTAIKHEGIFLTVEGNVDLQLSSKSVGMFEAFYNTVKPIPLMYLTFEVARPGKLPPGKTEIPFEFPLKARNNKSLYETYHGVFVNIQYALKCDIKRSMLSKDVTKLTEFFVEYKAGEKAVVKPVEFSITPQSLQNVENKLTIPRFLITGNLDSTSCKISEPLTGQVMVEKCDSPIKSIELQLVRVETCGCAEGYAKDATEIQNIQLGEGDVCRGIAIPIYMIFPRLFTCPTLITSNFKVEFELNIVVVFENNHLINENFAIKLMRF